MMGHFISVVTNFTASQKTYLKFLEVASDSINLCVASYKPDVHEFNTYLKKALIINKTINKQKGQFAIGAVATEKDIDFLFNTGKRFKEHGITFRLQVEKVNGRYRKYIKKDIDKILYFGRSYGLEGTTEFHDRLCLSGKNYFVLTPYGHAFRCHSAISDQSQNQGYLGNLLDGTFSLHQNPVRCSYEFCNCVNADNGQFILPR